MGGTTQLRYDDPGYGGEKMQKARELARLAMDDLTMTPEARIAAVVNLFPGGTRHDGPSEWVEAVELAIKLQDKSTIINCGRCYRPEECVGFSYCRRIG